MVEWPEPPRSKNGWELRENRRSHRGKLIGLLFGAFALAVSVVVVTQTVGGASAQTFYDDFTTAPVFNDDYVFHVGNACTPNQQCRPEDLSPDVIGRHEWPGDHNMACDAPTTSRTVHVAERNEMVYYCAPGGDPAKGHMMTSMDTTGYAILAFSPNQTFTNVDKVCWDINATNLGGGKWTNVVIVPEAEYLRHPNNIRNHPAEGPYRLDYVTPGFNDPGGPGGANLQTNDILPGNEWFGLKNFLESMTIFHGDHGQQLSPEHYVPTVSDKAARYKHCMIDTAAGVQVTRINAVTGALDTYNAPGWNFPQGKVRVIFQDDMYDPPKREWYNPNNVTWHWDNIEIGHGGVSGTTTTTAAPTTTTTAPTTTSTAPTTTSTAPTTTSTTAPTTTTTAPTTTTTAPPTADPLKACPVGWPRNPCRVPTAIKVHMRTELGTGRGNAAIAAIEKWYATP